MTNFTRYRNLFTGDDVFPPVIGTVGGGGRQEIYDYDTGNEVADPFFDLTSSEGRNTHGSAKFIVQVASDFDDDTQMAVYSANDYSLVHETLPGVKNQRIQAEGINGSGELVISPGDIFDESSPGHVHNLRTGQIVHTIDEQQDALRSVAMDEDYFVTASDDGVVRIYDNETGQVQHTLPTAGSNPRKADAVAGKAAIAYFGSGIQFIDLASGTEVFNEGTFEADRVNMCTRPDGSFEFGFATDIGNNKLRNFASSGLVSSQDRSYSNEPSALDGAGDLTIVYEENANTIHVEKEFSTEKTITGIPSDTRSICLTLPP